MRVCGCEGVRVCVCVLALPIKIILRSGQAQVRVAMTFNITQWPDNYNLKISIHYTQHLKSRGKRGWPEMSHHSGFAFEQYSSSKLSMYDQLSAVESADCK